MEDMIAKVLYGFFIGLGLLALIVGLYRSIRGGRTNRADDDTLNVKSLGDISVNDLLKGDKVKVPWFTVGVLLSQKSEHDRKHRESMKRFRGGK